MAGGLVAACTRRPAGSSPLERRRADRTEWRL